MRRIKDSKTRAAAGADKEEGRRPTIVSAPAAASPELLDRPRRRALWRLRYWRQCRMGERRNQPRHGEFRGQRHPRLVEVDGPCALSECRQPVDHRRWWRQQRLTRALVEG